MPSIAPVDKLLLQTRAARGPPATLILLQLSAHQNPGTLISFHVYKPVMKVVSKESVSW